MMQALSRSQIFKQSVFVDNQIAFEQQSIYRSINQDDPNEVAYMMPFLDHLQPVQFNQKPLDGFCVLAYDAENKADYDNCFPDVMVDFFMKLKIKELYLLTAMQNDWKKYVFENKEKKKQLLNKLNGQTKGVGFRINVKDLPELLPLFLYAHPDYPHIILMPAEENIPISLFLCKDGNLHTLFDESMHGQLEVAAREAGLMKGSFEVCQTIKNNL